jgi:CRP/FNR family cyclic AMP-dependent transcriptional regulator
VPYEYTATAGGLVFAAGACPLDEEGRVVEPGDLEAQSSRAADNLLEALSEAGAGADDLVKTTIYVVGEDGREVILDTLGQGDHFGELALIDEQPRSAHVIAMEDANLIVLRREDFRKRVEANPSVAWSLLLELSRRLRRADDKIGGLVLLDVPGRIARLLLDLSEESGTDQIEKSLTHQTIAQMIGASRETVSRAMKDFQDAGWINVERRRISLANRDALEHRAQVRE